MATKDHVAGYAKYFGNRFANLSPEATTEEQIKDVYKEWASKFDEVILSSWVAILWAIFSKHRTNLTLLPRTVTDF